MPLTVLCLLIAGSVDLSLLDRFAQARDVPGLTAEMQPGAYKGRNPFAVLKSGGAYGVGRYGWHALDLVAPSGGKRYVVFSTPLTSEDIGERLFEWDGQRLTRFVPEDEDDGWAIDRHDFQVSFDIPSKRATLKDSFAVHREGSGSPLLFRMSPAYVVKSLSDDQGRAVPYSQAGGVVIAGVTSSANLVMTYEAVVDLPRYAGCITSNEAMLTNDYWYPMIARKPAPYDIEVTAPAAWTTIGQGELVSVEDRGSQKVTRWKMDLPVVYYSLNSAPYRIVQQTSHGKRFSAWSQTTPPERLRTQTELYPAIIEFYERYGKFPFSGYGAVITPNYGGGALEAYSFATYDYYPGEDAHEPAHTWWGGIVNNTYLHSLWNESFAVFSEGFYARNVPIGNVEERRLAFVQTPTPDSGYDAAPLADSPPDIGPVAEELGYGKGAFVLQMLEQELGSDTMLKCMQEWIRSHDTSRGGEWEDFENVVARVAGGDMKWFFDQWIRRPGYADFTIEQVAQRGGAISGLVRFKGKPYRIDAEVLLQDAGGARTYQTVRLDQTAAGPGAYRFEFRASKVPVLVSFDPWRRIVRPIHSDEKPFDIAAALNEYHRYTDPKHADWLESIGGERLDRLPADLDRTFLVGSPETLSALRPLCAKAGITVTGTKLAYRGTTVDLNNGAALAVVDLGAGKRCLIGLGKVRNGPNSGRARLALFDGLGRMVRGVTDPKTTGFLTFRL